jgi:hypothetical protein
MARIELKFCTIRMKDGLKGTALLNQADLDEGDTTLTLDTVALNTLTPEKVPVGATFTILGETNPPVIPPDRLDNTFAGVHTVVSRTQAGVVAGTNEQQTITLTSVTTTFSLTFAGDRTTDLAYDADKDAIKAALVALDDSYTAADFTVTGTGSLFTVEFTGKLAKSDQPLLTGESPDVGATVVGDITVPGVPASTTDTTATITFTPPLGPGTYTDDVSVITFGPQQLNIKMGEGNLTYTEHRDYQYLLDRGYLDTVREPKDVPMDVKVDGVYEHVASLTGENVTPIEALKGTGRASEWVSSSPDQCEPYCIDLEVDYEPPCAPSQAELTVFPMFRAETREMNFNAATIMLTGKCFVKEPIVTRPNA